MKKLLGVVVTVVAALVLSSAFACADHKKGHEAKCTCAAKNEKACTAKKEAVEKNDTTTTKTMADSKTETK